MSWGVNDPMIKRIYYSASIWAIVYVLVRAAISLFMVPYITKRIGVEAYGFVSLANTMISYIDVLAISFNYFAQRNISIKFHREDFVGANEYYTSVVVANVVLILLISGPAFCFLYNIKNLINVSDSLVQDVKWLFFFILLKYFVSLLESIFEIGAFIRNRVDVTLKNKVASNILQVFLLVILFSRNNPRLYFVGVASFSAEILNMFLQFGVKSCLTSQLKVHLSYYSFGCVKELFSNGIWVSINNIGNILNHGLDLLITNLMISQYMVGLIAIAKLVESLCYSIIVAVSDTFKPKQLKYYSAGDIEGLTENLKYSMKITGAIFIIILGVFIGVGDELLKLWLSAKYTKTVYWLAIICLASECIPATTRPLYYTYTITKRMKVPCYITLSMGALNVLTMYILLKTTSLGGYAVVLTTMVLNILHLIDAPLYASYCLKVSWKTFYSGIIKYLIGVAISVILALGFSFIMLGNSILFTLLVKMIGITAIMLLIVWLILFEAKNPLCSEETNQLFKRL